jgi:hydroxyacylglutathione hydrolase
LFFRQVLQRDLGCASYIVGDCGQAAVIDPRWDVEVYLEIAQAERLEIRHVIDTHDHADHVSGRARLTRLTGARAYRPAAWDEQRPDALLPGHEISVGALRLLALETPGHRPQHLSFAITDLSRGPEPWLVLTGDSLLVGDLARPDLVLDAEDGAAILHTSIQSLLTLGDHTEVWPAHVGGSLCGGAGLSGKTSSTIGFERRHNPLLQMDQAEFVRGLTETLPPRPPNVERIVELNRQSEHSSRPIDPAPLAPDAVRRLLASSTTILDGRLPPAFDAGHLPGAINLPVTSSGIGTRAGWTIDPARPIVIVADDEAAARTIASALHSVGLWQTVGYLAGDVAGWRKASLPVAEARSWDLEQLAVGLRRDAVDLVDVRDTSEWVIGHVPGSHHLPLHRLSAAETLDLPQNGRTTAVACAAGTRAAFAASLLRRAGCANVVRVDGGGIGDLGARGIRLAFGG